jgi:hypothetical protein
MKHRSRAVCGRSALFVIGCAWLSGCQDPLTDPATVLGPRVIGARVRAAGDPRVAEPAAGQSASIDWLLVSNRRAALSARVAWCRAEPTLLGAPRCDGPSFDEQRVTGSFGEPLTLDFSVPADALPGDVWLAWLDYCENGEATFDASESEFDCSGAGESLSAYYRGFLPSEEPNQNPSLGDDQLLIAGSPWLEAEAPPAGEACGDSALARISAGQSAAVTFALVGDDREALESEPGEYATHDRESLVYTHVASHPGLDRAFSAIDFDSDQPSFELPFDFGQAAAPAPEGETLRFFLVVRDERGGVDWLRRDACLLP